MVKEITKEQCEFCSKTFKGNQISILRQMARHRSNGTCEEKRLKKLILKVKESKTGQKRVTIPRESEIKKEDYVEVKKHE